jgi:hypothetical protein
MIAAHRVKPSRPSEGVYPVSAVITRGSDPPYPPMSVRAGLIARTAIVSGLPARTKMQAG